MRSEPEGPKIGELLQKSPMRVKEVKGDWAYVNLNAWVRKSDLTTVEEQSTKTKTGGASPASELTIQRFSLKHINDGLNPEKMHLTLFLKNNTANTIKSWKAVLVANSDMGFLFREQIQDDSNPILAGQTIEINFNWQSQEEPFFHLINTSSDKLKLDLYQVILQ